MGSVHHARPEKQCACADCFYEKLEVQDFMKSRAGCITKQTFFEEGLQYHRMLFSLMIADHEAIHKYLERDLTGSGSVSVT